MKHAAATPTLRRHVWQTWTQVAPRFLPFADAASTELPLGRLLRLALFQVSVGMAAVLLIGTLNRVMIVELGVAAWLVAAMVALPLVVAPFRALVGFRSDTHRSVLGWKRVPFIWAGTWLQFGGLAIMPFALILLSGDSRGPAWLGPASAALAFLLTGAGMQTVQTAGLALATDLATEKTRPRVVALMYVMLLVGMVASGIVFGLLLADFTQIRLIQVVQGAAALTLALNLVAMWKQEARDPSRTSAAVARPDFRSTWRRFARTGRSLRFLVALGLGTAAFSMQDIILEPYGGEILRLSVSATTTLTATISLGALAAFMLAARLLGRGLDAHRLAALGLVAGVVAFSAVIFAEPLHSAVLFVVGAALIGFGGGLFAVGTLTAAMSLETQGLHGMALGAWGAVQAACAGIAIALGGAVRDGIGALAMQGALGEALRSPATGYSFVYHCEMYLLFIALVVLGPLVRRSRAAAGAKPSDKFGLADFPG
ncbi:MAG TPA: BCD family MFS transporter [Methylibium sp.]|uniref:BCD family MFS transporter n=1 Tax=Methylibium sp. TaxID=2067992 RepID=UPI002DBA1505|nr:BCD family MFS transporter [Methylibium sp.]HEU4457674.1 BCD family MFS transporter [Methylibium sp.]